MSSEVKMTRQPNDSIWDMSLFVEAQVAQAFACTNCNNIPRQCINDVSHNKIYCEFCVAQLKMTSTRANTAIDKIIDGLKVKCININTANNGSDEQDDEKKMENADKSDNENDNEQDIRSQKHCAWTGTLMEWKKHNKTQCPFAKVSCLYCGKYAALRYLIGEQHEDSCDEVAIECENGCGAKLFRKAMAAHLLNECTEQSQTCNKCNRTDIKKKDLESHYITDCNQRFVECKYAPYGCSISQGSLRKSLLQEHYAEYGTYHLELKVDFIRNELQTEIKHQSKMIEHLNYRNVKLLMQIHQKETLKDDFLLIFESKDKDKNSFIAGINLKYNSSKQNMNLIKSAHKSEKKNLIYKRVKDCSYCFASNIFIDGIIGITQKSKEQHIASCVATLNNCICTFNILYRIGGDSLNASQNSNICNILGTDVVFQLPQLLIPRFNHRVIYSNIHGILCVGGEPIDKPDVKYQLAEIEKEQKDNKKEKSQKRKAVLSSVEQLNLISTTKLAHYYKVRNMNLRANEEKLQMPPTPELKWYNLGGGGMKYRRDCPSVGLYKSNNKHEEQLFVAGGWNERDLSFVEMYNFHKREWRQLSSMNVKRNSAGLCEWKEKNNNMVVIGGWNKKTTTSVEEYDAHKNQWYVLKNTNHPHKYYPACAVYHDLNPFINSGYGVIVVVGNDGRLYGDEYIRKQRELLKEKNDNVQKNINMGNLNIKADWGYIEFYDPRDWIRKWTVIDNLPSFLSFSEEDCKALYFQSLLACHHRINNSLLK